MPKLHTAKSKTNNTRCLSWIWDSGYKWVNARLPVCGNQSSHAVQWYVQQRSHGSLETFSNEIREVSPTVGIYEGWLALFCHSWLSLGSKQNQWVWWGNVLSWRNEACNNSNRKWNAPECLTLPSRSWSIVLVVDTAMMFHSVCVCGMVSV